MEHLIEFQSVYKIYQMGDTQVRALDGVDMTIDPGEFVAIVGQSGSGKSTAMNIIGCLDVPTSGTYHLGGMDVSTMHDDQQAEIRNKMLGFIFQQYNLIPKLTVQENVELPLLYAGISAEERRQRALPVLCFQYPVWGRDDAGGWFAGHCGVDYGLAVHGGGVRLHEAGGCEGRDAEGGVPYGVRPKRPWLS